MCLNRLKKFKTSGVGWKTVNVDEKNNIRPPIYDNRKFHPTRWNKDVKRCLLNTAAGEKYKTGYHIFTDKEDAVAWQFVFGNAIKKVKYRKIVNTGQQSIGGQFSEVVVAKEFRFIKDK